MRICLVILSGTTQPCREILPMLSVVSLESLDEELLSSGDLISRSSLEGTLTLWVPLKDGSKSDEDDWSLISSFTRSAAVEEDIEDGF